MSARFPGKQARVAVALTMLLALALLALVASEVARHYRSAHEMLATVEPRHARLKGFLEIGDTILANRASVEEALGYVAHPADRETGRVGTDLQQRVRRVAEEHELSVSGSQILEPRTQAGFALVTVSATMDGETDALAAFLTALANERPPIVTEKLAVQAPRSARRGEVNARVSAQLTVSVIHLLR